MDKFCQDWVSNFFFKYSILLLHSRDVKMELKLLSISTPTAPNDPIAYSSWPRVSGKQQYFHIGSSVQAGESPHGERMYFWNEMKAKIE